MLVTHPVGRTPTDAGAALTLDGDRVFENVGLRPLWFVVADAQNEPAPTDPRAGHLLQPGQRETVRTAMGTPVWVWSQHETRLGVGPAWQVAGGGAPSGVGAGGATDRVLFAGAGINTTLDGVHALGATILTLDADADTVAFVTAGHRCRVGNAFYEVESSSGQTITIANPGLVAEAADEAVLKSSPLYGGDDQIQLPGPDTGLVWRRIDVHMTFTLETASQSRFFPQGRSEGGYYHGAPAGSWVESFTSYFGSWRWQAFSNDPGTTFAVGLLRDQANSTQNLWSLEYNPVTHVLDLGRTPGADAATLFPRIADIVVAGASGAP